MDIQKKQYSDNIIKNETTHITSSPLVDEFDDIYIGIDSKWYNGYSTDNKYIHNYIIDTIDRIIDYYDNYNRFD